VRICPVLALHQLHGKEGQISCESMISNSDLVKQYQEELTIVEETIITTGLLAVTG